MPGTWTRGDRLEGHWATVAPQIDFIWGALTLAFSGSRKHPSSNDRRRHRKRSKSRGADPETRHPADQNRHHDRLRLRDVPHAEVRAKRHRDLHGERGKSAVGTWLIIFCSCHRVGQIWRNYATLVKNSAFVNFSRSFIVFMKIQILIWQKNAIGEIDIVVNSHLVTLVLVHMLLLLS